MNQIEINIPLPLGQDDNKCQGCGCETDGELHTCPYGTEICGSDKECNCCDDCVQICHNEI